MSGPSLMIEADGNEYDVALDNTLEDQLREAMQFDDAKDEDAFKTIKVRITDFGELDSNAMEFDWTIGKLITLGEAMEQHGHDPDLVCAALNAADGDVEQLDYFLDRVSWVGDVGEDEKDYAQYVVDEGLMGDKLDSYLDFEALGRDVLQDQRTTTLKDGRIIAWNE